MRSNEVTTQNQYETAFFLLSDAYYRISAIDLNTNHITNLKLEASERVENNQLGDDFMKAVLHCAQNYVEAQYRDDFLNVLSPDNIKHVLNNKIGNPVLTYRRKVRDSYHWVRSEVIPVENYSEENSKIIWYVKNIAEEKAKDTQFKENMLQLNATLKNSVEREIALREELSRVNLEKTQCLMRMSHDIKTPLNAILGISNLSREHRQDELWIQESFEKIQIAGKHLHNLINEILTIGKSKTGTLQLSEESFSMTQLVSDLAAMVSEIAQEKHQKISLQIHDIEHDFVVGDSLRLRQIMINLVSNAIKYTPQNGEIRVTVTERKESSIMGKQVLQLGQNEQNSTGWQEISCFECRVQDNGIGIKKENLKPIFEPYKRVVENLEYQVEGSGLGLSIVKELVELMDGEVYVESEYGKGSTFVAVVRLKCQKLQKAGQMQMYDILQHTGVNEKKAKLHDMSEKYVGKRILVVEDDSFNRELEVELFKMLGLAVEMAENGEQALAMVEQAKENYYDMILMDVCMPGMDGYDTTRAIGKLQVMRKNRIPIVAMTANSFSDVEEMMHACGMCAYVEKPLNMQQVLYVLDVFLKGEKWD